MTTTAPTPIDSPPDAPSRLSPTTFASRADAWLAWEVTAVPQFNAAASNVYNNAVDCKSNADAGAASAAAASASQTAAGNSASAAAASAGATQWVSGGTYSLGDARWSPATKYVYRCIQASSGRTTDPSADTAYWALAGTAMPQQITVSGTSQTAVAGAHYYLTNAAATTVTLPGGTPGDGDAVWVTAGNGRVDNLINANGKKINGIADNMMIDQPYVCVRLRYVSSLGDWRLS